VKHSLLISSFVLSAPEIPDKKKKKKKKIAQGCILMQLARQSRKLTGHFLVTSLLP